MARRRTRLILLATFLFLVAVLLLSPAVGSQQLNLQGVWQYALGGQNSDGFIFFRIRLPRVLLGVLTGGALAVAGVAFQSLLRNPLATPYTLGVASGGALGALLVIKSGVALSLLGFSGIQMGAFVGSLLTVALVYGFARRTRRITTYGMILAGVTINYFFAAMILLLHYISDFTETHRMIRWTIGGLDVVDYVAISRSLPVLLTSFAGIWLLSRPLNLLSTSEDTAASKGIHVPRVQLLVFLLASLMTGSVVALSGPIGFIGLIIPHLLRLLGVSDHRYLIPASLCLGGGFLALADTVARTVLAPIDLPVGILTTLMGGPFFLWLLRQNRQRV